LYIRATSSLSIVFFNIPPTTQIYTLSLHDALPICGANIGGAIKYVTKDPTPTWRNEGTIELGQYSTWNLAAVLSGPITDELGVRSEEHTSELQSQSNLVCRLLLEKKKTRDKHVHRV